MNINYVFGFIKCWDYKCDFFICIVFGFIVIKDLIFG